LAPTLKWWLTTKPPKATSSDSFATLVNQTPVATEVNRTDYNTWALSSPAGYQGCLNIANPVEDGGTNGSGKWVVTGAANYATSDGTHESAAAYTLISASGVINPASFLAR